MSKREPKLLIEDMIDSANKILSYKWIIFR